MIHIKLFSCLLFLFCIGIHELNSQTSLYIYSKTGSQTQFLLSNIDELTFNGGIMTLSNKDKTYSSFLISEVQTLTFNDKTVTSETTEYQGSKFNLYPNPVINELHVQYSVFTPGKVQIQIVDLLGKIVLQQSLENHSGINNITLPVKQLRNGLYFVQLQNETQFKTLKFIKN